MTTNTHTIPQSVAPALALLWDKITANLYAKTKAYGQNSGYWRQMGEACASLTLAELQHVVASVQASLPELAELHALKLIKTKVVTAPAEDLPTYTAGLLRDYQRQTHRDIGTYLVPAYNQAQAQLHGENAKLAHYYRASGEKGVSSAIHAKPQKAKAAKTLTAAGKSEQGAPMVQPPLPIPQQAETLGQMVAAMADANLLTKENLFSSLESGFSAKVITLADVVEWAQAKLEQLEKQDAAEFARQQSALAAVDAFQDIETDGITADDIDDAAPAQAA